MGRFRASQSNNPIDRQIAEKMLAAEKLVLSCVKLCELDRQADVLQQRLVRATRRDLGKILDAISSVRRIGVLGVEPESPVALKEQKNLPIEIPVEDDSEDDGDS